MRSMVEGALRALSRTVGRARKLRRQMTLPEVVLWEALRKGRLAQLRFRRQHPTGPYILDFYCSSARVVLEIDGTSHDSETQAAHDEHRTAWLLARGLTVLHIAARDVLRDETLEDVLRGIEQACAPSTAFGGPPPPLRGGGTIDPQIE